MTKQFNPLVALLGLLFVFPLRAAVTDGLQLTTKKPHPLAEIVWALQTKYNWPLTFEEPPVLGRGELITETAPTGVPILVRRMQPMSISLSTKQASAVRPEDRLAAVQELLQAYARNGTSDTFRAVLDGRFIHIVPATARGADGNIAPFDPMLGTRISFDEQRFTTLYDLVDRVIEQVSLKRGVPIVLGEVPTNLFRQSPVVEVAQNEPARDVLERAFWGINGMRLAKGMEMVGLTWTLLYDPTGRQYWFHVGVVNISDAARNSTESSPKPKADPTAEEAAPGSRPFAVQPKN